MAAGILHTPGTAFGPCDGECKHIDCAEARYKADVICHYCETPIGYETLFYHEGARQYVHASCLEENIERNDHAKS